MSIQTLSDARGGLGKPRKSLNILLRYMSELPAIRNIPDGIVDGIGATAEIGYRQNAVDSIRREKRQTEGQALQAVG
jgi:hypothetical protein